jgi:hypothetical protein
MAGDALAIVGEGDSTDDQILVTLSFHQMQPCCQCV